MTRQSISFTKPNDEWLKTQVDSNEYASKSEVVNDLIRQARGQQAQLNWLRAKLEKSEQSGLKLENSMEDILAKANLLTMAKYILSKAAEDDLIRIYHYGLQSFGQIQADKYFQAFTKCFERIAENPFLFEAVDHIKKDYRRCVCGSDSIFYKIENGSVYITAIVGRQDIDRIF